VATLTIRGIDDELRDRLKIRAAQHSRSMEAEVREILAGALAAGSNDVGLGSRIHQRFEAIGGIELDAADRAERPRSGLA
jgi:plasmid stability protein